MHRIQYALSLSSRGDHLEVIYDLIVIGGGVAGCAAAITAARQGARVLLIEKGSYPRHKVCGEFISPEALSILSELLGAAHPVLASANAISQARLFFTHRSMTLPLKAEALSISRHELDLALWEAAIAAGVNARTGIEALDAKRGEHFAIETDKGQFESKAVVNATGRWARVGPRRKKMPQEPSLRWIGLKAHFRAEESSSEATHSTDLYFFKAGAGYCGVQYLANGSLNVAALVRIGRAKSLDEVFTLHPALLQRSKAWSSVFPEIATAPVFFAPSQPVSDGILNAGDAAGFVDPFAGDGIALALRAGLMASANLWPAFEGRCSVDFAAARYSRQYRARFSSIFRNAALLRRALALPYAIQMPLASSLRVPLIGELAVRLTRG